MTEHDAISQLEMSVIGAVLINPDTLALLPSLATDDFRNLRPRATWEAIRNLEARNAPIDVTTIGDELAKVGKLEAVGFAWLGECSCRIPTVSNAIEYAARLRDHALRWRAITETTDALETAKRGELTGAELLGRMLATVSKLDAEQPEAAITMGDLTRQRVRQIEQTAADKAAGKRALTGFPTGVEKLDETIGGWQAGIVNLPAARPGMGKSALGIATADACTKAGIGVHVFSLEDTKEAYADRVLARSSGVAAERIRNADLRRVEMPAMSDALMALSRRTGWLVDDRSGITAEEIVRSVRRRRKDNRTALVLVDYIQLVKKPHPRMTAHEALGENITTLADAAKHDGMAYVVFSQLNREIEKREDRRPRLSDLRESGSLEERAKIVIGLYRGAAYKTPPIRGVDFECNCRRDDRCEHAPSPEAFASMAQLLVLKNSGGRTGMVRAQWRGETMEIW